MRFQTKLTITAIIAGAAALSAGCAGERTTTESNPPTSSAGSAATPPTESFPPVDPLRPRKGPAKAAVGTPYPFDLYVHCGGAYTTFAGRAWQTDTPPGNPLPKPEADGRTKITGYLPGTMELVDDDQARFVIDDTYVTPSAPVVLFRPAKASPPPCK